jgi:hypothetical protein
VKVPQVATLSGGTRCIDSGWRSHHAKAHSSEVGATAPLQGAASAPSSSSGPEWTVGAAPRPFHVPGARVWNAGTTRWPVPLGCPGDLAPFRAVLISCPAEQGSSASKTHVNALTAGLAPSRNDSRGCRAMRASPRPFHVPGARVWNAGTAPSPVRGPGADVE